MKGFRFGRSWCFIASFFSLILVLIQINFAAASFNVCEDSFSISNAPGYCFAMAAFSRWYYLTHQGEPPLRKVLDKKMQLQIASELQSFYSKNLISLQADYCNKNNGNWGQAFRRFVGGLMRGEPGIVLLMNKGPRGAVLHAVLAYEYLPESNKIKIYDPNYINQERILDLNKREYTSLDITYHAICFPEVFHEHPILIKKMENLYTSCMAEKTMPVPIRAAWRGPAATATDNQLKGKRNSRGPTR